MASVMMENGLGTDLVAESEGRTTMFRRHREALDEGARCLRNASDARLHKNPDGASYWMRLADRWLGIAELTKRV
jgi:hypothetical protein